MKKLWISVLTIVLCAGIAAAQTTRKSDSKTKTTTTEKPDSAKTAKAPAAKSDAGVSGKVDVNAASKDELEKLPGIGPVTSQKIIDGRPYKTKRDLLTRKIVGQKEYDSIKDNIIAHQDNAGGATKSETKASTKSGKKK